MIRLSPESFFGLVLSGEIPTFSKNGILSYGPMIALWDASFFMYFSRSSGNSVAPLWFFPEIVGLGSVGNLPIGHPYLIHSTTWSSYSPNNSWNLSKFHLVLTGIHAPHLLGYPLLRTSWCSLISASCWHLHAYTHSGSLSNCKSLAPSSVSSGGAHSPWPM